MDFSVLSSQSKLALYILVILLIIALIAVSWIVSLLFDTISSNKLNDRMGLTLPLFADVAYFFEKGARSKQEDAVYISHLDDYVDYGIFACVSDGMGGLKFGADISKFVIDEVEKLYPVNFYKSEDTAYAISKISKAVYDKYGRKGGATLVLVHIFEDKLQFYSVGDSNIILIRNKIPTILNYKQNYNRTLIRELATVGKSTEEAYENKKGKALVDFMGNNNVRVIYSQTPMKLMDGDTIFVCSDGVTDALGTTSIPHYIGVNAKKTAEEIKIAIRQKNLNRQDNYSGVVIRLNRYNF